MSSLLILVVLLVFMVAEFLLALGFGAVLMLAAPAGWREALRESRRSWLKWVLTISPALIFVLRSWVIHFVNTQWPAARPFAVALDVMMVVPVMLLPALAAVWWCLPPRDKDRFSYFGAGLMAFLIALVNYPPVLWFYFHRQA